MKGKGVFFTPPPLPMPLGLKCAEKRLYEHRITLQTIIVYTYNEDMQRKPKKTAPGSAKSAILVISTPAPNLPWGFMERKMSLNVSAVKQFLKQFCLLFLS